MSLATSSTLFPYTTLFRSTLHAVGVGDEAAQEILGTAGDRSEALAQHPARATLGYRDRRVMLAQQLADHDRSEEHTSELQSLRHLVCRLLLEKKKQQETNA